MSISAMMAESGEDFQLYLTRSDHAPVYHASDGPLQELSFSPLGKTMTQLERSMLEVTLAHRTSAHGVSFCGPDNIEKCIAQLNQEVTSMGMPSLYGPNEESYDLVRLINCSHSLLLKHQASSRLREELENKIHRVSCDNAHLRQSLQRGTEKSEQEKREMTDVQNKMWQVTSTNTQLKVKVKTLQEEVKRLKGLMHQRDTQHKHEVKKKEREVTKLRDRLNQLLGGRGKNSIQQAALQVSLGLQRADGKRGTWKTTGHAKNEEDLYRSVLVSAEEKFKSVLVENASLRRCLSRVQNDISLLLRMNNNNVDSNSFLEDSTGHGLDTSHAADDSCSMDKEDAADGLYEMPYELAGEEINTIFKDQLRQLKRLARKAEKQAETPGSPLHSQKRRASVDVLLSPTCRTSSLPHLDEARQAKEMERLQAQVTRYKHIIEEQEKLIEQSLEAQKAAAEASLRLRVVPRGSPGGKGRELPNLPI